MKLLEDEGHTEPEETYSLCSPEEPNMKPSTKAAQYTLGPLCVGPAEMTVDAIMFPIQGRSTSVIAPIYGYAGSRSNAELWASAPKLKADRDALLGATKIAEKFYIEELTAMGECDHSVNVCVCGVVSDLESIRAAIKQAESK